MNDIYNNSSTYFRSKHDNLSDNTAYRRTHYCFNVMIF